MYPGTHQRIDREKTWKREANGIQNGAEMDANTHQQSMPKLVAKRTMKIIQTPKNLYVKACTCIVQTFGLICMQVACVNGKCIKYK